MVQTVTFRSDPDARSQVSEDDILSVHSAASTVATTASLSSRIASLALDYDAERKGGHSDELPSLGRGGIAEEAEEYSDDEYGRTGNATNGDHHQEEQQEEVIEMTEAEVLQQLDAHEPAFQVPFASFHTPRQCLCFLLCGGQGVAHVSVTARAHMYSTPTHHPPSEACHPW